MFQDGLSGSGDSRNDDVSVAPINDAIEASFSKRALSELAPVFQGALTTRVPGEDSFQIYRPGKHTALMRHSLLNGAIEMNSVDVQELRFDLNVADKKATRMQGVSLNLSVFGMQQTLDVESLTVSKDAIGEHVLRSEMKNPLPQGLLRIVGMPSTFNIDFPIREGGLYEPRLSKMFADAAESTGPSIAGLLTADLLKEASNVSLFVESNPLWVESVVKPALGDIARELNLAALANQSFRDVESTGAALVGDKGLEITQKVMIAGVERQFKVHLPAGYDASKPTPVVILLHGHGQDGPEIARHTRMTEMADRKGFIAIYPDARVWAGKEQWRAWDTENGLLPPGSRGHDVDFLRLIIESSEKAFNVDSSRIYMAGMSNGGMMSYLAAGHLSDKLAAIAVVSGAMSGGESSPGKQLSVLHIHGTDDVIVPHDGLKNVPASLTSIGLPKFKSAEYTTNYWVEQNKITDEPVVFESGNTVQRRFINRETGVEVNQYTIHGGRHVPERIDQLTEKIWEFFEAHPKVDAASSGTNQEGKPVFDLADRLQTHLKTRGVRGLEDDFAMILAESDLVGNGSFSPSTMLRRFESKAGIELADGLSRFLKSTDLVSKHDSRIEVRFRESQYIPLGIENHSSRVTLNGLNIDNTSFRLNSVDGRPQITGITGVNLDLAAFGSNYNVRVKEAAQLVDGGGEPYYRISVDNPLPAWARTIMLASSEVPVSMRLNNDAHPGVMNQREIKDATLGYNPVTRGYIDTSAHISSFVDRPTLLGGLNVGKDLTLYGGSTYGGFKLGAMKFGKTGGRVGAAASLLILAPSVIHGIERLFD